MKIRTLHLIGGAKKAGGLAVIIDVFRAFSTACYVFENGAKKIIPVGNIGIAYKLKKENPGFLLIGEREGKRPPGFDYGNSPAQIENADFVGKTVVQTTSAGTLGIANAANADEIITGSFVNAQAIVNYIKKRKPGEVSLVCMGNAGTRITDEDALCAEYIRNGLENKANDFPKILKHLMGYESAQKFFDPAKDWAPERDFGLCLALDKFNFVLKAEHDGENQLFLNKIDVGK